VDWPALVAETAGWSEDDRCKLADWSAWVQWPPAGMAEVACVE
jgi:hypothetical protein